LFAAGLAVIVVALAAVTGPSGTSAHPKQALSLIAAGLVTGLLGVVVAPRQVTDERPEDIE
jgi:cytochrome c biogenesis protein CcdA